MNVKPDVKEETEEQKEQKHKTFVEKYEKEIKHFGESHFPILCCPHSLWVVVMAMVSVSVVRYDETLGRQPEVPIRPPSPGV